MMHVKTLWTAQNLIDTGVNNTGGSLVVDTNDIKELVANDGSFNKTVNITLNNANFSAASGSLTENTDYTLALPQGLSSSIQITSLTTATLTIAGTASSHLVTNNETKNLSFNVSSFSGASNLSCTSISLNFKFYNPFEIIYENIADVSATTGATWDNLNLTLINGNNNYGTWVYVTKHLKIETYGKKLVTNTGTRDITLLKQGDLISTASNFTAPEDYPGQLDIRYDGYTAWEGKTGYIGFTTNHNGEIINGWMKASVSDNGETLTVYEYAFSTKPNGDITAGQTLIDPNAAELLLTSNTASESSGNNGNINFATEINISGAAQFSNKTFVNGVDFTTTAPSNYSLKVIYVNSTEVKLVVVGTVTNHTEANNTSYNVTFNTSAFNNGFTNIINYANSIDINFIDPYTIITGTLNESVDSASAWDWFSIPELDGAYYDYGSWYFGANHLKIETYGKRLVTNATTRNITLLENGELISSASNFTSPGAYPDQLDLYTSTHTEWSNRTGYIGFESQYKGKTVYGWLKVTVAANGTGYTVNEYAFYNKPESPIVAGSTTLPNTITWTGTIDTSWTNPDNWSTNTIPTITSEVIIPANANMFPIIDSPTTVGAVIIESGASLITNSELTATVTYNRNLATNNWYLVSSPLKNETITNLLDNNVFALGTGNNIGLAPYQNDGTAWNYQNANTLGNITSGKGYSVKLNLAADLKFTGTTNSTTVTYPVTMNTNSYNLIGNPYTSYINLGDFFNANPLNTVVSEATAWVWNQTTNSYDLKLAGIDGAFQIAPGQGFFISASANSNVTFDKANQSHTSGTFQRQSNSKTQINITATAINGTTKTTKLYYLEGATTGFDNGYDGSTFKGTKSNFNFYSQLVNKENNKEYAIQSLPKENLETTIVPVGLEVNTNQTIVFSAESFNLPSDTQVYIEDKVNNKFINLSKEKYNVSLKKKANTPSQFFIHTTSNKINNDTHTLSNISVYQSSKNQLTIKGLQAKNNLIKIYSPIGKTVMVKAFKSNGVTAINLPEISSGIYIVNVTSEGKKINKKIILKN